MFLVVAVHAWDYLGPINGHYFQPLRRLPFICDPIFFTLSGYFAIRQLKTSLRRYYWNKFVTLIFPMLAYSVFIYLWDTRITNGTFSDYLNFSADSIDGLWWFVRSLMPMLIAAPFLYTALEALNDTTLIIISKVVFALICARVGLTVIEKFTTLANVDWFLGLYNLLESICPVGFLTVMSYVWFFIMGYFYRRLRHHIAHRSHIYLIGLFAALCDCVFAYLSITPGDQSYFWIFETLAMFVFIDSLSITNSKIQNAVLFLGKHSFSIYLLNYKAIVFCAKFIYASNIFEPLLQNGAGRLVCWFLLLVAAYLVALAVAFVFNTLINYPLQKQLLKIGK